jgi:uncharacterized repeat protein (TIGR04076 family)
MVRVLFRVAGESSEMKRIVATVVRVTGTCNAGYRVGDEIVINLDDACIVKEQSDNLCIFALGAILANMSRIRRGEQALAACPDPATGLGGNVIFRVKGVSR